MLSNSTFPKSVGTQLCVVVEMVVCGKGFIHGAESRNKHISVISWLRLYQEAPLGLRPSDAVFPPITEHSVGKYHRVSSTAG